MVTPLANNAFIVLVFTVVLGWWLIVRKTKLNIIPSKNIVVITGCDTGFGFTLANRLALMGYVVIAGCLTKEGVERLRSVVAVALICDVTKGQDIVALALTAEKHMTEKKLRIWAVVNNAGIANGGQLDWMSEQTHRKVMEVNYFGTANVIKAMLHLLKNSRIINVSSAAGITGLPSGGPYCGLCACTCKFLTIH